MTDDAKKLAAELSESSHFISGLAAVLAPIKADVERLMAERKPIPVHYAANCAHCGHSRADHEGWSQPHYHGCSHEDCECGEFGESTAPAPVPQPGATRGAEVAEKMIAAFAANVRWICTKAIDAERAAARRAALDEAEAAVRVEQESYPTHGVSWYACDVAAAAVVRLRESGGAKKPVAE